MSIEEFISINFYGMKAKETFEEKINNLYGEEVTNFLNELLDVIYSDLSEPYIVESLIDGRDINVSSKNQFNCMKQIDTLLLYISKDRTDIYSKLLDYQFDKEEELMQTNKNGKLK